MTLLTVEDDSAHHDDANDDYIKESRINDNENDSDDNAKTIQ